MRSRDDATSMTCCNKYDVLTHALGWCLEVMKFLKSEVSSWKKGNEVLEKFKSEMTFEDWNLLSLYTRTWT